MEQLLMCVFLTGCLEVLAGPLVAAFVKVRTRYHAEQEKRRCRPVCQSTHPAVRKRTLALQGQRSPP